MWYRFKMANIGGGAIKSTPLLPVSSESIENINEIKDSPEFKNYDELNEYIENIKSNFSVTKVDVSYILQQIYKMSYNVYFVCSF